MRFALALPLLLVARAGAADPCALRRAPEGGAPIQADCLPAISSDGKRVAIAEVAVDGGRGYPNLAVRFVPLAGRGGERTRVLTVAEVDQHHGGIDPALAKIVDARLAKLNALLAAGGFERMKHVDAPKEPREKDQVAGNGVDVHLTDGKLVIVPARAAPIERAVQASAVRRKCRDVNQPFIDDVWTTVEAVVVKIAFHGNDSCWEPSPRWIAVGVKR